MIKDIERLLSDSSISSSAREVLERVILHFRTQEARLDALLNTVTEAVCIIDENDHVTAWNNCSEQLYGIPSNEIIGNPIDKFFSNLLITKVMKERQSVKEKYHNPCPGTHVLFAAQPVRLDNKVIGGVCAERDITENVHLNQKLSHSTMQIQLLKEEIDKINSLPDCFAGICGHSPLLLQAISMAKRVSATNVPILLRGESGTGKEIFARAIHAASGRKGTFVPINCGAIPATLFESELLGYESGAFTGADKKGKVGLFEQADGGTLFLDEIGELPKEMQVKLLRVLQEQAFYRVGGNKVIKVDVRIIAATHRNLEKMMENREFREDLYYRLNVVSLSLPSLRERREDIPELIHRGLQHFSTMHQKATTRVDPAVMAIFLDYSWPGNVRELYNVLERLIVLAEGDILTPDNLPLNLSSAKLSSYETSQIMATNDLTTITDSIEKETIMRTLQEVNFNKAAAAKRLGIPRSTLYYKLIQHEIIVKK